MLQLAKTIGKSISRTTCGSFQLYTRTKIHPWIALDFHNGMELRAHGLVAHEQHNNQTRKTRFIFCRLVVLLFYVVIFSMMADIFYLRISIMLCAESITALHSVSRTAHIQCKCELNSTDCNHVFLVLSFTISLFLFFGFCRFATNAISQNGNDANGKLIKTTQKNEIRLDRCRVTQLSYYRMRHMNDDQPAICSKHTLCCSFFASSSIFPSELFPFRCKDAIIMCKNSRD